MRPGAGPRGGSRARRAGGQRAKALFLRWMRPLRRAAQVKHGEAAAGEHDNPGCGAVHQDRRRRPGLPRSRLRIETDHKPPPHEAWRLSCGRLIRVFVGRLSVTQTKQNGRKAWLPTRRGGGRHGPRKMPSRNQDPRTSPKADYNHRPWDGPQTKPDCPPRLPIQAGSNAFSLSSFGSPNNPILHPPPSWDELIHTAIEPFRIRREIAHQRWMPLRLLYRPQGGPSVGQELGCWIIEC